MVRPKRWDTVAATRRPMFVEPVKEMSGMRGSSRSRCPTSRPEPMVKVARAPKPSASSTGRTTLVKPMPHSGVLLDVFHTMASPQT